MKKNLLKNISDCILLFLISNAIYISNLAVIKELDTLVNKKSTSIKPLIGNGYRRKFEITR